MAPPTSRREQLSKIIQCRQTVDFSLCFPVDPPEDEFHRKDSASSSVSEDYFLCFDFSPDFSQRSLLLFNDRFSDAIPAVKDTFIQFTFIFAVLV